MTAKEQSTKKGGTKGKAEGSKGKPTPVQMSAADELTAARLRAILADPKTSERVKGKLRGMVNELGAWTSGHLNETPGFYARAFRVAAEDVRAGEVIPTDDLPTAEATLDELARLAAQHEPEGYKVARRCAEIYEAAEGDGATYFVERVDAVLEGGADGLMPNPDSKYFTPLFVEAWNDRGRRDRRVRALLDLIRRVDEGADLNVLRDEAERADAELFEARKPKDVRLAERLTEIFSGDDPARAPLFEVLTQLESDTQVYAQHPQVVAAWFAVAVAEARRMVKAKDTPKHTRVGLKAALAQIEALDADE